MHVASGSPSADHFLTQQGRLPRLGDSQPPWYWRGWLLPYVILLHQQIPTVADRWGYHLRTLEANQLLDEPIPTIQFGPPDPKVSTLFHDWSRLIGNDLGGWSDFRTLLDWLSWGLALRREPPHLSESVNEQLYRQVDLGRLLVQPYDYLGEHVASSKARGWNPTAFFPTPHSIVALMVKMTFRDLKHDGRDPRTFSVNDPAVGSGRMLLHASSFSMNLWGQDIDPLCMTMCKINGALYAPWLTFPLPATLLNGKATATAISLVRVDARRQGLLFAS